MQTVRRAVCVSFFLLSGIVFPVGLSAQETGDDFPAAAKEAVGKGVSAAGQKEWKLAIRYFEEARKAAPRSPITLYNLALAEMQIPGRELRAVGFFEAYLLAAPQTDKAAAIRDQIAKLELKTEANTGLIIDMLKSIASKYAAGSYELKSAQQSIAVVQAHAGDVPAAMAGAQQLATDSSYASLTGNIATALAEESHFDEAKRLAGQMTDASNRSSAYYNILSEQAKQGLVDDARATLAQVSGDQSRYALCDLAKAEFKAGDSTHALQRLARADELTKAMPVKDIYAKSSRNNALHTLALVHLEANDLSGAKAIVPLLFNEKGYAYQSSLIDYVNRKVAEMREEKIKAGDLSGAETMVDQIPGVAQRAGGYVYLAGQSALKDNMEHLSSLARKTEGLLASAKRAKEKFMIETALSDLAIARKDSATAARWRQQAIAACAAAVQEPELPQESEMSRYRLMSELGRLGNGAAAAKEETSLRKIVETARAAMVKPDANTRTYSISTWKSALLALALQTHKEADVSVLVKFVQDFAKDLGATEIKSIATSFADAAIGEKFVNLIPDPAERTKALNEYLVRKYSKQYDEALKKADFDAASKAVAQLPEGTDKVSKQTGLLAAVASEGDFAAAEKSAAALSDGQARLNGLASIAYQRSDAGDHAALTELWQQKRSLLAGVTDPVKRLALLWDMSAYPPTPALVRETMPAYFAEALALPDPKARVEQLRLVVTAAHNAGLFLLQREARAEALLISSTTKDLETLSLSYLDLNASECLEQAAGPARDSFLQNVFAKYAAAGNIPAAQFVAAKMSPKSADAIQGTLATAFAERGDFDAARAAQEKIKDRYALGTATGAVVHAFVKAGNLVAAKEYAESHWPDSEATGDGIVKEMAAAGELAWASEKVKRLGNIYGPGARATVVALQIAKGDMSGAEEAWAACTYDYHRTQLIRAAAEAGHVDLALKWLKSSAMTWVNDIVAAQVVAGDVEGARALAAQVKRNNERVSALRAIATAQAKKGDLDGARETFRAASKQDKRTAANFDSESFVGSQLANALAAKPDFTAAMTVTGAITDPYWRDNTLSSVALVAAPKDGAATANALKAMTDPQLRSNAVSAAVAAALKVSHLSDALAYVDLAPDEGFRAVNLGALINYGIDHGDISEVLPRVVALKDPVARAWLLTDALRGSVFTEAKTGDTSLVAAASAAVAALPANFWQARLYADLARFAGKLDPASAPGLREKTLAAAKALAGNDAAKWQRYVEGAKKHGEVAAKDPVVAAQDESVQKARESAIDAWTSLLQSDYSLNAPLFTDFKATLDGLANSVPASAENKASQLFSNVQQQAQKLNSTLKEVRTLRKKSAADIAAAAKAPAL